MQQLGLVDSLLATITLPIRRYSVAAPLAAAISAVLLAFAFWFDDCAIFGYPIDYAVIGMRLPNTVFEDHGWSGLAVWVTSAFLFSTAAALWSISIYGEAARRLAPIVLLTRSLQFFAANLIVPTLFVPVIVTVYYGILEDAMLDNGRYGYDSSGDFSRETLGIATVLAVPLTWLFLRLALWPTMILFTGWRGALRRAWAAGHKRSLRVLCHIAVMAFVAEKIFDVLSFLFYRLQFALIDYTVFDTVILLAISSIGILCTVLLGYWISALMVLHLPWNLSTDEQSVPGRS